MKKLFIGILLAVFSFSMFAMASTSTFNVKFNGNYNQLFIQLKKKAESGDAVSQNNLGGLYDAGLGTEQNYQKAKYWYDKAAKNGYAVAYNNLGLLYLYGNGVDKNSKKAEELFNKAIKKDIPGAIYNLGLLYLNGNGVKKDLKKAKELLTSAAEKNEPMAQTALSTGYYKGIDFKQDYSKALYWGLKAANQGYVPAQIDMAIYYSSGKGSIPKDLVKAYKWGYIASTSGNRQAANGVAYIEKEMPKADITKAKQEAQEWLSTHKNINTDLISAGTAGSADPTGQPYSVEVHTD